VRDGCDVRDEMVWSERGVLRIAKCTMNKIKLEPWLILSHAFNMDGRAASQTITDKLPHLRSLGAEPVVVSSVLGALDTQYEHHRILPLGGAGLRFDLRHVLRRYVTARWLYQVLIAALTLLLSPLIVLEKLIWGLDSQASWSVPAFLMGWWLVRRNNIKVVYSTGGAYSAHLAGYWLKRCLGLRWIAEIHDPMIRPNELGQSRNAKFWAKMERRVCDHADLAWWFTEGALAEAQKRHPLAQAQMICLLPGAEPPYIPHEIPRVAYQLSHRLVFAHFGSLSNTRSLKYFLSAFAAWSRQQPERASLCEIHIYGAHLDAQSLSVVNVQSLTGFMRYFGRLEFDAVSGLSGRQQVAMAMRRVDCLLLTHGDSGECREYIPSKFYEYLWANRPQLMMVHENPQLSSLGQSYDFYVTDAVSQEAIVGAIEQVVSDWEQQVPSFVQPSINPIDVKTCTAQIVAKVRTL
jgi:hypothetical protein